MGPTGAHPQPSGRRRICYSLRLELHTRGGDRWRGDGDVAYVRGAILQRGGEEAAFRAVQAGGTSYVHPSRVIKELEMKLNLKNRSNGFMD
ncbi:hypothetical protein ACLOJK_016707 [Asimina triloba]